MLVPMSPELVRPLRPNISPKLSVIVTTYNRPDALRKVFESLARCPKDYFEVIVADDASAQEPRDVVFGMGDCVPYAFLHVWQQDLGFRDEPRALSPEYSPVDRQRRLCALLP